MALFLRFGSVIKGAGVWTEQRCVETWSNVEYFPKISVQVEPFQAAWAMS